MNKMNFKELTDLTTNEKAGFKSASSYRGRNRCQTLRQHDLGLVSEKNMYYDAAITEKDILRGIYSGEFEKEEVNELVSEGIDDRFKVEEVARDIRRYLRSEKRKPKLCHTKFFEVEGEKVSVRPDFIFDDGRTLEVVFIRVGKPDVKYRGRKKDASPKTCLELYFGLIYGESEVPEGEKREVKASYYFMRKDSDTSRGAYDYDFFDGFGNNVVSLARDKKKPDELEELFKKELEEFREGVECNADACGKCPNRTACEYQKSPEVFERKTLDSKKKDVVYSDAQEEIISFREGYARVLAKAGTGKTECMTERGARMYAEGTDPRSMLFVTFTDAGAYEMKERLCAKSEMRGLEITPDEIPAMTFHTLGYGMIRDNYTALGFAKSPIIIDTDEARKGALINRVLEEGDFYTLKNRFNALEWAFKAFDVMKAKEIDPSDAGAAASLEDALAGTSILRFADTGEIAKLVDMFEKYCEILTENCWLTFADIEPLMNKIMREMPEYVESLGYEHIIVDEFQDSNDAQMETIRHLCGTKAFKSLMVVGDDNQSIYGFRDTSQENIINFWDKIGIQDGKDMFLLENRRSTPEILEFADRYINEYNDDQIDSHMVAVREHGFKPVVNAFWDKDDEKKFVVDQIVKCHENGFAWEDIAIIGRTKAELVGFAAELSNRNIPWITKYPMPLLDNSRVQAAISLASAFYQPEAESLYFPYVVAMNDGNIWDDMTNAEIKAAIASLQDEWMAMDNFDIPYQRKMFHDRLDAIKGDDEIYAYFLELLYENEDLQSELEYVMDFRKFGEKVAKKLENGYEGVVITTAHSSKGLEWPVVFNLMSGYDNAFIHKKAENHPEVEEIRRLLYVSMTRARDILVLTGKYTSGGNYKEGYEYNRFVKEIFDLAGKKYDPDKAQRASQARKKAARDAKKAAEEAAKKGYKRSGTTRRMTDAEAAAYDALVAGATQMSISDL